MLTKGNVLYFTPYHFKNNHTPKNKFFVVLKNNDNKSILASLPTSKNHIPHNDEIKDGCIELPDICLNCFVISEDTKVTTCNKKFDFMTYIYGHELETEEVEKMNEKYVIEGSDYIIWGKMKDEMLDKIIECLSKSESVKNKHKKMLLA